MQNQPQVSLSVLNQLPDFIKEEFPKFEKFLSAYYGSVERGGGPVGILNNLDSYFNLSKYDLKKLSGRTRILGDITSDDVNIQVESTDSFPDENGTVLINDEVIYYESVRKSPNVVLTPDISYSEFEQKQITLANPYQEFNGTNFEFDLKANNEPVFPPSADHLIIRVYNEYLRPNIDFIVLGSKIRFTTPPRAFNPVLFGDSSNDISFKYLKGFLESTITPFDPIAPINTIIDPIRYDFPLKVDNVDFIPSALSLVVAIVDGVLLEPNKDYSIYESTIIFKNYPVESVYVAYINAPLLSVGKGAKGYSVVNDDGELESILVANGGSGYKIDNSPKVSLVKGTGKNATAKVLVDGVKSITLLDSGKGYSPTNPPRLVIQDPTTDAGVTAKGSAVINPEGHVESVSIDYSGSGYDFVPRIQFVNPTGAKVGNVQVNSNGQVTSVEVLAGGSGYTTAPLIYIDAPLTENGIQALLVGNLGTGVNSDKLVSVTVATGGTGYNNSTPPRAAVIQPTGAQILDVEVGSFGRVVNIELLSGGFGYEDVPSVYIVDDRLDGAGNPAGGTGAKAAATIFNGQIIDINITSFGEGYSSLEPPKIFIADPPGAKASCSVGQGEITGFEIIEPGEGYTKSELVGCSRGVSGIVSYDAEENAEFRSESESIATDHSSGSVVTGLDAIFFRKILDRLTRQYIPGLPKLDPEIVNISNILRTVKDFYASKGTSQAISYLFKILYGVNIDISYPKDQIIKPSAASWEVDTILRARLISGNPEYIKDTLVVQEADPVDTNVKFASANVENFIAIQTASYDVYELILSEESIVGKFVVPYTTKLAEPIDSETSIITVDSTIGWPERNGEIIIGTELIRYKEKSLTQFIECTRGINQAAQSWDSATVITSNFYIKANAGTSNEVVMSVLGIVESNNTQLLDESSYYLPGDKLTISKLGSLDSSPLVSSWLYNVKKLIQVESITYGGVGDKTATVTCTNPHGLLVGDQVTVYGANPIVYNGSFLVTARESALIFKYELPQPATGNPVGNILISVDLNKGKSDAESINSAIKNFATNIQNSFFNDKYVYIAASGIPNYKVGPFLGTSLLPGNQRKLYRFPRVPETISLKPNTTYGAVGSFVNGVSAWNYKSNEFYEYGPITKVTVLNAGSNYDADSPPALKFVGGGGSGASGTVVVDGSITDIEVLTQGDGYDTSPLVSIAGGGGTGASATAIVTNGKITKILMNSGGSGYTSAPTVTITGGNGSGCTAIARSRGPIKEVVIDDYGQDYTSAPEVVLSSGEAAAAQAYVSNGRIISIAVISSGNGYTTAPKVVISGEGYGAVAIANIQTEGVETGKVTSITIVNKGIGYKSGTTQIRLESIGEGAEFETEIFKWTFNLQETTSFDYANGSIFEGFNKQFGGEYAHASNPKQLRYVLGDNLTVSNGEIVEKTSGIVHSPIIGWAFDGNPIYGPYGLTDPTNLASTVVPIKSSYDLKSNLVYEATINPNPERIAGPPLSEYPAGTFIEDYEYNFRSEQFYLDEYNGRFCKTPDFPEGTYAYFITLTTAGLPAFPYIVGPKYYSTPDPWDLSQFATQAYIPSGVVRYRAPFENVDIDVERNPNESTNALTLENGDILTFEVEDENKDGVISQDEIDDPDIMFEESRLELFDYFPKIDVSSRVDIEVDTTTKFEDAKISGFLIENPGINHQVGDRLVFDDTGTEGYGASAVISEIKGVGVTSYTYTYDPTQDEYFGVVQTTEPHNMIAGDTVNINTTPAMEPTSKTIYVRTIKGLEDVQITTTGLGYDPEIPIDVVIDSDTGLGASVQAIVNQTGALDQVKIVNSGRNYTSNPKIRISHPQIQKRATYYALKKSYGNEVRFLNAISDSGKNTYLVGSTQSTNGDIHGLLTKINSEGVTVWSKSVTSTQPITGKRCELVGIVKNGTAVYVIGQTYPNQPSAVNFNPDIFLARYTENASGTSVTLTWQREIAGISGVLRNDYVTDIAMLGDNIIISGWTTTNATGSADATLMYVSPLGDILHKRKVTSTSGSEKFLSVKVDSNDYIYAAGVGPSNTLIVSKSEIINSKIVTVWQKQFSDGSKTFDNITLNIDEYDQIYVTSTLTSGSVDKLSLVKIDANGNLLIQNEYNISSYTDITSAISSLDIFGDINLGFTSTDTNGRKTGGIVKLDYKGVLKNAYVISGQDGYILNKVLSDVSGDPMFIGETKENTTKFLYRGSDTSDSIGLFGALTLTNAQVQTTQSKWGGSAFAISSTGTISTPSLNITSNTWTIEGWIKLQSSVTNKVPRLITITDTNSSQQVQIDLFSDSSSPSTNGKLRISNSGATVSTFTTAATYGTLLVADFYHIAVTKVYNTATSLATYTLYFNGSSVASFQMSANVNPTSITIGSTISYNSHPIYLDSLRYITTAIVYTSAPLVDFTGYTYASSKGHLIKFDRNADAERVGNINLTNNTDFTRTLIANADFTATALTLDNDTYSLGAEGYQILDYNDATSFLTQDFHIPTDTFDQWSSRTATIPSPGGRKAEFSTKAFGKFFFRHFTVEKFDNIREFQLNQAFTFVTGDTLVQKNSLGSTVASGRIVKTDTTTNKLYVTDVTGTFTINSGTLENSNNPVRVNEIENYAFEGINNTTPGTFSTSIPGGIEATFKPYSDEDYLIRIDEIITGSTYARGSVVTLSSSNYSFNTAKTSVTITGLASVTKITLITNLKRTMQIDSIGNTNRVFARTTTAHYLNVGDNVYTETAPVYSTVDGSFYIDEVISKKEFAFTINTVPTAFIGTGTTLYVYVKHPVFKFIYGQQYTFDVTHVSNIGYYLSFYRDNLTKIEYTFKNIVRKGRPGIDAPGASPFISFKVTDDVANISYYADPSRIGDESPVSPLSYIDVVKSPYIGKFEITEVFGGTITTGANKFKFKLSIDPEKNALSNTTSYSTTSSKVAGSIANIRLVNGGGFYKKLPVIVDIESVRKIERVDIIASGTEYEPGEYFGVPILGDGAGGKVRITVAEGSDPAGQITEVVVTDPGKGYTTAFIDVDAIDGILGPDLGGSGAQLEVVIPPKGTGSSIFVKGENIGKIKKLKNNNFGFNYTHDYTLRPEITFPINLQLINTSILSNIKVTNPGSGYTSVPAVIITGGGGSGAEAVAELRNGRISAVVIKNAGFGYSTAPTISLKTSFTYVVNLDLGLFQVPYPHGIQNGAEITFAVENLGEGAQFPLTSFGYIISGQTYYAISGESAGLEPDQLRVALTPQDAASGNYISFVNVGTGRQVVQTDSFGGSAEAVVETGRFLSGELVFQGESLETATATGFVSENDGWQIGPRVLKLINTEGEFAEGQIVSGVISKASGTIENINAAKGVIEVDSVTKTPGRFLNDIGKPNEIVQKIQDSYLYQSFSYNVKSPISIDNWKTTVIENTHPTGFKIFGEIEITEEQKGLTDKTDFELTKSVNLVESSVVAHIDNFGIVEPVYQEFDNTQILFRTKRLTSSEEILTSYVQKIDDISNLFDGERTTFPLTINGQVVIANTSQLQLVINGVAQNPGTSFNVQQGSIVFNEPPPAPTKVSYAKLTLQFLQSKTVAISNVSGILPELGQIIRGLTTNVTATVISSTTNAITFFNASGNFQTGELLLCSATGLSAEAGVVTTLVNDNVFEFGESITNMSGKTADVEEINLNTANSVVTNIVSVSKTSGTYQSPTGLLAININDFIVSAKTRVVAKVIGVSPYIDPTTNEPISSIVISDPSSFFGLLYNRIISPDYPNVIIDDISKSNIEVVDVTDGTIKVESNIPEFETINTSTFESDTGSVGTLEEGEFIQNLKIEYTNSTADYALGETVQVQKITYKGLTGGNFQAGDIVKTAGSAYTAELIGVNYATKTLYVGTETGSYTIGQTLSCDKSFVTNDDIVADRFADASNLILANKLLIADVAVGRMLANFPGFTVPNGNQNCKDDIMDVLEEMCFNLKYGGNHRMYDAGLLYINNNYLLGERDESVYAFNQARDMAIQAMRNETININGYSTLSQFKDLTVEGDQSGQAGVYVAGDCANVAASITSLFAILTQAIGSDATPGNLTGITRTNIGTVSATISASLDIPFIVENVNQADDLITSYQLFDDTQHRFRDAANLIRLNGTYIIEEAVGRMKARYTDLIIPGDEDGSSNGTNRCKLDLSLLLNAVVEDLEYGGNANTLSAARFYLDENGGIRFIPLQLLQSCFLHRETSLLCQDAANGNLSETPLYTSQVPLNPLGVTVDPSPTPCANVLSKIDTLWTSINEIISTTGDVYKDAGDLLWFNRTFISDEAVGLTTLYFTYSLNGVQYNAFDYPNGSNGVTKCKRDIKDYIIPSIIADLVSGGDANTISAMQFYVDGTDVAHVKEELLPTIYALEQTKTLCQYAVDNWIITGTQNTLYTPTSANISDRYRDTTITLDDGTYGGHCTDVKSAIEVLFTKAIGILLPEREQYIVSGRFFDAADLIDANAALIADVAVGRMLAAYPTFTVPGGNQNCKDDIIDVLKCMTFNLRYGGNQQVYDAARLYLSSALGGGAHVSGEETQSVYAFNQARDMAIQAMRNQTITLGGYTTLTQVKDLTITADPATGSNQSASSCANVASSITTLMAIVTQAITNGNLNGITRTTDSPTNVAYRNAAKLIMFNKNYFKEEVVKDIDGQYAGFGYGAPSGSNAATIQTYRTKCKRDIGYIVDAIVYDLLTYGNSGIVEATQSYIDAATGTIISLQGELAQSIFGYQKLQTYMKQAIAETLVSPSPLASFYSHTDSNISLTPSELASLNAFIDDKMSILLGTLNNSNYLEANQITPYNSVTIPLKTYPDRIDDPGITGRLITGDYIYGLTSGVRGEIKSITTNRANVKKILTRVRINFALPNELFAVNEEIVKQGAPSNAGIVYSYSYGENFNYVDVVFTGGVFAPGDILINDDGHQATVVSVTPKTQISDITGSFETGDKVKGFASLSEVVLDNYYSISAPVLDNTGSKLTLETESYFGNFNVSEVVYSNVSNIFIDVKYGSGLQIGLGDVIQTKKIYKITISIASPTTAQFPIGYILKDSALLTRSATIVGFVPNDVENPTSADIYLGSIDGGNFEIGAGVEVYEEGDNFPIGVGAVVSVQEIDSEAYGFIEKIITVGDGYRLFLSRVKGTFNQYAQALGRGLYKSSIMQVKEILGRVKRSFRGFDGVQDEFKLTITNGVPYFPNADGHLLVFVNGILQPPTASYSAFSDIIQFTEPPELGASFHAVYVGKLRQLDDISFEFDSLRNSFNLKLDEVFYSLSVTAGSSSANIKPENNIIVSLNGVIQEPGVAFELVGSRIIFAEIPRAGSSFVAFSYIGSDADVIAKTVVPPIESGDELEIEGEDQDRTVAIIESSNSLVTFDYTGSVFGRNAAALTTLISGRVSNLTVTSSGNGFTSRPTVSIDSSTGFDAQVKALVGVSRVDVVDRGSGYAYPAILVDNEVSDTPADLLFDSEATKLDSTELTFDAT